MPKAHPINVYLQKEQIITEQNPKANALYDKYRIGTPLKNDTVQLTQLETLFLLDKDKIKLYDGRKKQLTFQQYLTRIKSKQIHTQYLVFKDLRNRGYIVKTALKFGAEFRVYDKGIKPGQDHAKWIVYPVLENKSLTWYEFSAKNRVAHSTKKKLLIAVVDQENDVTYYQVQWLKP